MTSPEKISLIEPCTLALRRREWLKGQRRRFFRLFGSGVVVMGLAGGIVLAWLAPSILGETAGRGLGIVAIFGTFLGLKFALIEWRAGVRRTFSLAADGVVEEDGLGRRRFAWDEVDSWRIDEPGEAPGMRELTLTLRGGRAPRSCGFDPGEVEEQRLRATLFEHLGPVKCASS